MDEPRRRKKSKSGGATSPGAAEPKATKTRRRERRLLPGTPTAIWACGAIAALASMAMGAGVFAQFLAENPQPAGTYLLVAGSVVLAAVILLAPDVPPPILVGDAGVGVEVEGDHPRRIGWYEIERVGLDKGSVVVEGSALKVTAPLGSHPQAAAWIVREARERIPGKVTIEKGATGIPEASESAGEVRRLEAAQVAGRRCRASDQIISYEPDAVLCPRCGEAYHRENVPSRCLTCNAPLG